MSLRYRSISWFVQRGCWENGGARRSMMGQSRQGTKSPGHRKGQRTDPGVVTTCEFSLLLRFLQPHGVVVTINGCNGCSGNHAKAVPAQDLMMMKMASTAFMGPAARAQGQQPDWGHPPSLPAPSSILYKTPVCMCVSTPDRVSKLPSPALCSNCQPLASYRA